MAGARRRGAAPAHCRMDARGGVVLRPSARRLALRRRRARRAGAAPGTRVSIELPAGLDFAQALHACLLLGAVAVPVDLRLSAGEREHIAAGAAVRVGEPLAREDPPTGVPPAARLRQTHELDATALVIHTSGTTSSPRAIELTYGNILWSALGSAVALGSEPQERWLCTLPLSHVGGLSILLRSSIYATTAVVHERFDAERVLGALQAGEATLVSLVATTLARLLDAGLARPPALRCALTGGGPVPAALLERARDAGVPVSLTYGLTEAASQVTTTPVAAIPSAGNGAASATAELGERAPITAGPPLFCTRVRIAPDGEILVRGPTVAPAAPAEDGWLHTGDLGGLDEHGGLLVSARKADTIVSGGENVAPAEVEAVLETHPQVLEAGVVGRPSEQWGEALTAWIVARPGTEIDLADVLAHCSRELAPFKVPKDYLLSDRPLPRTRSGKLLRRELRGRTA